MLSQTTTSTLQTDSFLNLSHGTCTSNPLNIEHILVTNFHNYIKGSRYHNVLNELLGDGIFKVDGQLWTLQRKIASHEFNTKSLKHFISDVIRTEMSNFLVPYLSKACDEDMLIDLQEVLQNFTFNNICNVAFGVDLKSLQYSSFGKAFDDAVEICTSRFLSPVAAVWKMKRLLNIGSEKRFKEAIEVINNFAAEIILSKEKQDQNNEGDKKLDLLSRFMSNSLNMEGQDDEQRRKFQRDIVISFVLAGRDSTSTALTWFFWLLAGYPHCVDLIRRELSSLPVVEFKPRIFSYDELKELHYLQAALSEAMRLFPPVPIVSRLVVEDDVLPDGTFVGKGWFADYSAYSVGRSQKVWGEDCMEFKPKRWLDANGVFKSSDQFRFPVFHCGPRMCLGKEMAFLQMKSIAAVLIHEFDIIVVDGGVTAEKMKNPPYSLSLLLKMKGGLPIRIKRRQ